jgi:hypothetical protein
VNTSTLRASLNRGHAAKAIALATTICLLLIVVSTASASGPPPTTSATKAFGQLLHRRFGVVNGFWNCPSTSSVVGAKIACLAEVRSGNLWHQVSALAGEANGHVVLSQVADTAWRRTWTPYSRHFIIRSNEPQVPGLLSVNSPTYDWGFLAECAEGVRTGVRDCSAYDGNGSGLAPLFRFACSRHVTVVICANVLGDAMRYRLDHELDVCRWTVTSSRGPKDVESGDLCRSR